MNPRIIDQGDKRWANLGYRTLPYTVVKEGCGLCAITMCAMELSKYWDYTPLDTIDFMRQYATNGDGTEGAGIDAGLDKYLGNHKRFYDMLSFWNELNKGNRIGIILFGANSIGADGTEWTKGGHYVMFNGYKYEDGQHWLYTKDSSYRHLDGFHSYERSMAGCISVLWTAEVIDVKNGWYKEDGYWYFYKDGKMLKNAWAQDKEGKWYWLGDDGKMVTSNMVDWKDNRYYLQSNGVMASSKWIKFKNGWRYFNKSGKMLKSRWLRYKNDMYYLDDKGYAVTGDKTLPCKFDKNGKLLA